ncbi:MAG: hydantoinase B/oxoprolinase family protein [Thermoleophilia bacterium]|nr:hydantoinase B/oxoprolinase family protein [Thermoleophilia bacterium]
MPLDLDLIKERHFRLEPPTERELAAAKEIDPTDFSIYMTKLKLACDEAREVMARLAISEVAISGDSAYGIYTANGDLAIAEVGTFLHVVTGQLPIKFVRKHYENDPTVGVEDGSMFFCNEAIYGGIHNPDQLIVCPIYHEGEIVAWVSAATHEPETGAIEPGGMPGSATDRYAEGLKVPPIKIAENFQLRRDIIELLENNVRYPLMISTDTSAKATCCLRLRDQVLSMIEEKGVEFFIGLMRRIIQVSEKAARRKISRLPDGVFRQTAFMDTNGTDEGLLRIPCAVQKKGDTLLVDYTGASPQSPGPFNAFEHVVLAHLSSNLFQFFFADLPASAGALEAIDLHCPVGSCLNANPEAAVSSGVLLSPTAVNAFALALARAWFSDTSSRDDFSLPLGDSNRGMFFGGLNQWGLPIVSLTMWGPNCTGLGARNDEDGVDAAAFWWMGIAEAPDAEWEETQYPYLGVVRNYAMDQGGPGKYRGGSGVTNFLLIHGTNKLVVQNYGASSRMPTHGGLFGGYAACNRPIAVLRNTSTDALFSPDLGEALRSGDVTLRRVQGPAYALYQGDGMMLCSTAGDGYGDVLERDPQAVMHDLMMKKISERAASEVYKVVRDPESLTVDEAATAALRDRERQARLERGRPYAEFVKDWETQRPPAEALRFYGSWPAPSPADY